MVKILISNDRVQSDRMKLHYNINNELMRHYAYSYRALLGVAAITTPPGKAGLQ